MGDSLVDLLGRLMADHRGAATAAGEKVVIGLAGTRHSCFSHTWHARTRSDSSGAGLFLSAARFRPLGVPRRRYRRDCIVHSSVGFRGLNVTHPFKQAVIPVLDRLSRKPRRSVQSTLWYSMAEVAKATTPIAGVFRRVFAKVCLGLRWAGLQFLGREAQGPPLLTR